MTSATNLESGSTTYTYNANGDIVSKTDARGITTCFGTLTGTTCDGTGYDALNRVTKKTYSDGTPSVSNTYDVATDGLSVNFSVGRLVKTATSDGKTAIVHGYDQLGRVKNQWQCTPQNCGTAYFSIPYGSAGNGTGVTIGYGFNGAAELNNVTSTLSDTSHPGTLLSNVAYNAFGAVATLQLGSGISESRSYTNRLWPHSYSATDPAGGTASGGSGSVTIAGSEQSVQGAPSKAQATVTFGGSEQKKVSCHPLRGCNTFYDTGTVTITVNGHPDSYSYGQNDTSGTIATNLRDNINKDSGAFVTAQLSGSSGLLLTAITPGPSGNYSLSTSVTCSGLFPTCSFSASSGTALTGGANGPITYDSGTISITLNGSVASSYTYGQSDSPTSIVNGLISHWSSSVASASPNGSAVNIKALNTGSATNYPLATSLSYDTSHFSRASFTATSAASLTGGTDNTLYSLTMNSYAPNGDVLGVSDSVNGNWAYTYDAFNRLVGANQNSGASVYSYVYDRFGNRWQQNGANSMQLTFTGNNPGNPQNNNRIDGYGYDAAGNVTNDHVHTYFYDAESRLIQLDGTLGNCSTATACYIYDAAGRRVRKTAAGVSVDYLYDLAGREITELSSTGAWNRGEVYAGARHLATYSGGTTYFIHPDWLGTERARTAVSGTAYETCTSLPFGDGLSCSGGDPSPMHFTGKQRDPESGLDDFNARYYASAAGRFISADWSAVPIAVPYANLTNPQTLNLYVIVADDPTTFADLDGHTAEPTQIHVSLNALAVCSASANLECLAGIPDSFGGEETPAEEQQNAQQTAQQEQRQQAQTQDASRWKQEVIDTIQFQKDARAAYEKFGPTAKSVEELENKVDKELEKKYGRIGTAGSTDSSGKVEIKPDPNPYTREATRRHESVHQQTVKEGITKYGKDTPAFKAWLYNPQNWAKDEVKAYSAGIRYLEQSLRQMNGP